MNINKFIELFPIIIKNDFYDYNIALSNIIIKYEH